MSSVPIDSQRLVEFFDQDYRLVNEHEFRRAIFKGKHYSIFTNRFLEIYVLFLKMEFTTMLDR